MSLLWAKDIEELITYGLSSDLFHADGICAERLSSNLCHDYGLKTLMGLLLMG